MADVASACRITRTNQAVIASENPNFNRDEFDKWLQEHETGYFVRDPDTPFDCRYFSDVVFFQIYMFESGNEDALFRRIRKT